MTLVTFLLIIIAWKLWQIEKWLRRLRINTLTPSPSESTETSVHQKKAEQPRKGTGKKGDPIEMTPEEYRKLVGLN